MTLREIISGYELLFERLKLSKDTRFTHAWIKYQVQNYRAQGIRETYKRTNEIESIWLQDFGRVPVSQVNSGDDPAIPFTSERFGKISLPPLVSLPNDMGAFRVAGSSKIERYYPIKFDNWFALPEDSVQKKYKSYMLLKNAMYLHPCCEEVNMWLILHDPLDGYTILTEKIAQDRLEVGQNYTVYDYQIIHNAIAYLPGVTFTAVAKTYSGNGYVKFTNMKRMMSIDDEYPIGSVMLEFITRMIFSIELKVDQNVLADAVNDSQDPIVESNKEK